MNHYTVRVCAGCGVQYPSRAADHAKRCPHRRYKWIPRKTIDVVAYADYSRVVNALLAEKGAECTCRPAASRDEMPQWNPTCPYHGDDGTRIGFLRNP